MIFETIILTIIVIGAWFIHPILGAFLTGALVLKTYMMVHSLQGATLATIDTWPPFVRGGDRERYSLSLHRTRHYDFYGYLGEYLAFEVNKWESDSSGPAWTKTWVIKDEPPRTKEEAREMNWYLGENDY